MATIRTLSARSILDSRRQPTVEVALATETASVIASVPSGASVGAHEAHELRDKDGGVSSAVDNVNMVIAPALVGKEFDQRSLDAMLQTLDGTQDKSRLGANAMLVVSVAFGRAESEGKGVPLYAYIGSLVGRTLLRAPEPLFNILNGGKHTKGGIDIQESMIAIIGRRTVEEKIAAAEQCVAALHTLLEKKGYGVTMGDEGGFAPKLPDNGEALELLSTACKTAGFDSGEIVFALDVAATSFYRGGRYVLTIGGERKELGREELLRWYAALVHKYPIMSIEDPFAEDDWEGFAAITSELGEKTLIVGDDLIVTNAERIREAQVRKAVNACIIKPNQAGTVSEALDAVEAARKAGWKVCASHRSGETMDTFIADFAIGIGAEYLKSGAPGAPERRAKYNRLMEIERAL